MFIKTTSILLLSLTIVYSYPCPPECICKPIDISDAYFTRISYVINCANVSLKNEQLVYSAERWTINEDKAFDIDDPDAAVDYVLSIDLSNSSSLKEFTNKTIKLSKFQYVLHSLSLANQGNEFTLSSNSFSSPMYQNLKILNLSSCCIKVPEQCPKIFRPLQELQTLDLSGSDMYKTCLNTPDTFNSKLENLILRDNIYDTDIFSNTSELFNGVRQILGTLDLQNSLFKFDTTTDGNCVFDVFREIKTLDLSSVQFESKPNDIEIHLTRLLKCKNQTHQSRNGEQLVNLYLRQLNLEKVPEWLTNDRFPILAGLDLSNNYIKNIDLDSFINLDHLSLAYNPIPVPEIVWRTEHLYKSINLRSSAGGQKFSLSNRLKNLFKLTRNLDYSENEENTFGNITNIPIGADFNTLDLTLNVSRTNIYSFKIDTFDLNRLDISYNHLTQLNLENQIKLNYIDCSNNQNLSKLILSPQLLGLNEIRCSNNSLKEIENFKNITHEKLTLIDLSNNYIKSLEDLFQNLTSYSLHTINLKSNLIKTVPSNIFSNKLISLYEINLSWNHINIIKVNAFRSPNLRILDLTGNSLKNVEPNAIFTASLRLFYITNDTQYINNLCQKSKRLNNFTLTYIDWLTGNGSLMKQNPVTLDRCLKVSKKPIENQKTAKSRRSLLRQYIIFEIIGGALLCLLFFGVCYYRRDKTRPFFNFQRYRRLNEQDSAQISREMDEYEREDDEIVVNLQRPPFSRIPQNPTDT